MKLIKVAGDSPTAAVAGAIAMAIREQGQVDVQAIGANAVNQATKALVVARQYLGAERLHLTFTPHFVNIYIDQSQRTAIRFSVCADHEDLLQREA